MPARFVLASFRSSTYPRGYASALHLLRPCWTVILSLLQERGFMGQYSERDDVAVES